MVSSNFSCRVPWTGQEQGGRFYSTSKYRPPGKLSYMCVPGDHPLLDMTVGQLINWASEMYSDQEVVVVSNPNEIRKTYTQFKKDVKCKLPIGFIDSYLRLNYSFVTLD